MSLCKGFTQGGSNADIVIADAFVKNLTGTVPIDWNLAWEAVVNDAENEPLDWSNEGRGGLMSWKRLNFIPYLDYDYLGFGTNSRSISRTLEYSYNDFSVATLGKGLGKQNYTTYLQRATNWQNLFKADQTSYINGADTGFTGFFQPKYLNGTWGSQDPILCSPLDSFCSLTDNPQETFEDSIWEYQLYSHAPPPFFHADQYHSFVPQDISTLIKLLGGPDEFVRRLDFLHTSGLTDIGNEPSFLTVFLYRMPIPLFFFLSRYLNVPKILKHRNFPHLELTLLTSSRLRGASRPLLPPRTHLHSRVLQRLHNRPPRKRRHRRHGLFYCLLYDGTLSQPGPKRLLHHRTFLPIHQLHQSSQRQSIND
jgi:Glycosyl hydrolase family 92